MAITESRVLPPQFIEDLAKDYGTQLTALTAQPIDTSRFAPTVAAQDPLQTQAATLASSGIGSFQPFINRSTNTSHSCWNRNNRCRITIRCTNNTTNYRLHVSVSITSY